MKSVVSVLTFLILVTNTTNAFALLRVKLDEKAANGSCLVQPDEAASAILTRNEIKVVREGGGAVENTIKQALGIVIGTIESLGAAEFKAQQNVEFLIGVNPGFSYHESGTKLIHINPGAENIRNLHDKSLGGVHNVAMLTHELAHYISLRDGFAIQRKYEWAVWSHCELTDYAKTNRYEEFAEVFAAYVTNPSLLQNQSAACDKARLFVGSLLQESPAKSESCGSRLAAVQVLKSKLKSADK